MPQRILISTGTARVIRVDREHESIEKAPPIPRRSPEKSILVGREPEQPEMIEETIGAGHWFAVNAADPSRLPGCIAVPSATSPRRPSPSA